MEGTILVSNGFELELHAEVPRTPDSRRQPRAAASEVVFCSEIPVARRCSLGGGGWLDRCGDGSAVSSLR